MVVRTQVTLDADVHRRAKRRAADLDISLAEYFRRVLDRDLGEPRPRTDPSRIFGLFDSGSADVAKQKDRYVGEAVSARHRRSSAV
jgi:hypothetical protein